MEEPIASYQETQLGLWRQFELFPDRIRVAGQGLSHGRFDDTVPLAILQPHPARVWNRGQLFRHGLIVLLVAIGLAAFFGHRGGRGEDSTTSWEMAVAGSMGVVGLILTLAMIRQVEFVRFRTDAGVFALDVARVGAQAGEFDDFVDLLIEQIRKARTQPNQNLYYLGKEEDQGHIKRIC